MKNFNRLGMIFVFAVALTGCSFLKPAENTDKQDQKEKVADKVTGKLADIIGLGDELICEYEFEGVVQKSYIKGEQYYAESKIEGKDAKSIVKDNCMWTWWQVGDKTQGTKMCFDPETIEKAQEDAKTPGSIYEAPNSNIPSDVDYSCNRADVDDKLFTPPADVEFTDLSAMMKSLPAVGTGQPNVINNGQAPSEEELKKLMEQFGQ